MSISKRRRVTSRAAEAALDAKYGLEYVNTLNAELNLIRHLLALAGAHHFVDVTRIRVKHMEIKKNNKEVNNVR
jgi:hypothetical protein